MRRSPFSRGQVCAVPTSFAFSINPLSAVSLSDKYILPVIYPVGAYVPANMNPIWHPYTSCQNTAALLQDLPGVPYISPPVSRPPTNTSCTAILPLSLQSPTCLP